MLANACMVCSLEGENLSKVKLRKLLLKLFLVFCALIMILFFHRYLSNSSNFADYFYQRVAQQGQLYWKVYKDENEGRTHFNSIESETETFFRLDNSIEDRYNYGIYKIMKLTTPQPRFWRKIDNKSSYTASTYASIYYYYKEIGMIVFSVFIGCLYWFVLRLLLSSISKLYYIDTFICIKLLLVVILVLGMSGVSA